MKLLELQRVETTMELVRIFAEVFKAPDPEESDGDKSMKKETCKGLPHSAFSCVTISVFTS